MGSRWADVVAGAPELAGIVRDRFAANRHHVLATVRPNGAPRLSGTEVTLDDEEIRLGMMADSRKLRDVERDPRVEIHSAPLDAELGDGDAKFVGRVEQVGATAEDEPAGTMFTVALDVVSLVRVENDELVLRVWTPDEGEREIRRH